MAVVAITKEVERVRVDATPVNHSPLPIASAGIFGFDAGKVSAPEYDLLVIGSGPAGPKCTIAAAKARKRVAVIDRTGMIGGVSVHTGTIPSKTVREAIFQLVRQKSFILVRPYCSMAGRWSISMTWSSTIQRSPKLTKWSR
jgi:NADPH-dependent 2,4-dienoyl-CoA reductase/sulfur reductase-like enzyme